MRLAGRVRSVVIIVLVAVVLGATGLFALFAREDPVCWAGPPCGWSPLPDPDTFIHGSTISVDSRDLPPGATESQMGGQSQPSAIAAMAIVAALLWGCGVLQPPAGGTSADGGSAISWLAGTLLDLRWWTGTPSSTPTAPTAQTIEQAPGAASSSVRGSTPCGNAPARLSAW